MDGSGRGRFLVVLEEVVKGFEKGFEEGDEEKVGVRLGRDDAVNFEEEGLGLWNQRVEAFRNGSAANQGLNIRHGVEDEKDERVRKPIKAIHLDR